MKIEEIKDPQIRALAWKYRKANKNKNFNTDTVKYGFNWEETKEGRIFWSDVYSEYEVEITEKMKQDHPEIFKQEDYFSHFENLSEKELFELWNEVCNELGEPEDKVDLTNNKQEEMKTTHTLENGTVLEVGKKYCREYWRKACYYEILFLGEKCFVVKDEINREKAFEYPNCKTLIPYEEPKEKIFENYKPYVHHMKTVKRTQITFEVNRPADSEHHVFYTLEEAKEQGLDLSIFNI